MRGPGRVPVGCTRAAPRLTEGRPRLGAAPRSEATGRALGHRRAEPVPNLPPRGHSALADGPPGPRDAGSGPGVTSDGDVQRPEKGEDPSSAEAPARARPPPPHDSLGSGRDVHRLQIEGRVRGHGAQSGPGRGSRAGARGPSHHAVRPALLLRRSGTAIGGPDSCYLERNCTQLPSPWAFCEPAVASLRATHLITD